MQVKKQIKYGALISYIALATNICVTLLYTPWMVAHIGKEQYGLYTLAISLINLFLVDFGLSTSVARFIAKYRAEDDISSINNFVAAVSRLYIGIDIVIFVIVLSIFPFLGSIYSGLTHQELEVFRVIFILVAGFNLISFPATTLSGYLNAYEQFVPLKICDLLHKILTVVLVVLALLLGGDVISLVIATAISGITIIIFKFLIVQKKTDIRMTINIRNKSVYKEVLSFSIWTMLITVAQRMLYNATPSVLAITTTSSDVAYFSPAFAMQGYYYSIASAINGLFLPRITRHLHNNEEDKLLPLMISVGKYQMFIMGLVLSGFVVIGREFMILWMGNDFEISYYCTVCMIIPQLFECSQQIGYTSIMAKGLVKYQALLMFFTSVVGLPLSFSLSRSYGVIGSCTALLIAGIVNVVGIDFILKRKMNFEMCVFFRKCYFRTIPPIIAAILIGTYIVSFIRPVGLSWLFVKGGIITVIYTVLMATVALSKGEKVKIKRYIKNKIVSR